jgi:TLC domain
LRYAN